MHHCGRTEVPRDYNYWCGMYLISCCLSNRVWFNKLLMAHEPLHPNLYIILFGPSGLGKNTALNTAMKYFRGSEVVNLYSGRITRAHLFDELARPKLRYGQLVEDSSMILNCPELSHSFGAGPQAEELVKLLTQFHTGGEHESDGTRARGVKKVENPCINWCAGTDSDWLVDSISASAIRGGFFARTILVRAFYDFDLRIPQPEIPPDYKEVSEHLQRRVDIMCRLQGEFVMSDEARVIDNIWYKERKAPVRDDIAGIWKREQDYVYKLSMLLSLADRLLYNETYPSLIIEATHIAQAQALISHVRKDIGDIIDLASSSPEREQFMSIRREIKSAVRMTRTTLIKKVSKKGVNGDQLTRHLNTLQQTGEVNIFMDGRTQIIAWKQLMIGGNI